ncbi:MAG: hypothetical protein GWQ05_09600 [Verrucomicrobiaceae bacterium]|nr:hypothetical protein [Verrucomicrobiaceae bacterium]NCF91197.1 hypothetical protein [Verrucomicrobiaceae bacterium]
MRNRPLSQARGGSSQTRRSGRQWAFFAGSQEFLLAALNKQIPKKYLTRLTVKHQDNVLLAQVADVTSFESAGNYAVAAEGDHNHLLRETLTALEKQLDPE